MPQLSPLRQVRGAVVGVLPVVRQHASLSVMTSPERLAAILEHLNAIRSDGPFMDGLVAEGPWWTPPEPTLVALYDAIIAASELLQLLAPEPAP